MFGISFFSNKVASHMFKAGLKPSEMPPNYIFKPACDALKDKGYSVEQAAYLWYKCLRNKDKKAIKELKDKTGFQ